MLPSRALLARFKYSRLTQALKAGIVPFNSLLERLIDVALLRPNLGISPSKLLALKSRATTAPFLLTVTPFQEETGSARSQVVFQLAPSVAS